jgi:hypothetical protein
MASFSMAHLRMLYYEAVTPSCLTDSQVDTLLSAFGSTRQAKGFGGMNLSATTELLYTPDFIVYSDALAFVVAPPVAQQPVVTSRQALLDHGGVLEVNNLTTLNSYQNCTAIF